MAKCVFDLTPPEILAACEFVLLVSCMDLHLYFEQQRCARKSRVCLRGWFAWTFTCILNSRGVLGKVGLVFGGWREGGAGNQGWRQLSGAGVSDSRRIYGRFCH